MKLTTLILVLATAMGFSAFAADEPGTLQFEGVIEKLQFHDSLVGFWVVSGKTVYVLPDTKLVLLQAFGADIVDTTATKPWDGPFRVGAKVRVKGFVEDGDNVARTIETGFR